MVYVLEMNAAATGGQTGDMMGVGDSQNQSIDFETGVIGEY